ncbi:MAG: hypothetical protein QY326_04315 [Bdellovibrionota bacterium]|nr:MAG: hypothetical protein QY326_04315 [Bdellovibrionota bacterium]
MLTPHSPKDPNQRIVPAAIEHATTINVTQIFEERIEECQRAQGAGDTAAALRLAQALFSDAGLLKSTDRALFMRICSVCTQVAFSLGAVDEAEVYALSGVSAAREKLSVPEYAEPYAALVNALALVYDRRGESEMGLYALRDAQKRIETAQLEVPILRITMRYNEALLLSHKERYAEAARIASHVVDALQPTSQLAADNQDLRFNALALYADLLFKIGEYQQITDTWQAHIESCVPWWGSALLWLATHATLGAGLSDHISVSREAANRGLELVTDNAEGCYCGALLHLGRGVALAASSLVESARGELDRFVEGTREVGEDMAPGMRQLARGFIRTVLKRHAPREHIEGLLAGIPDY